jgi:adenine-specific DNA-methyltransferase
MEEHIEENVRHLERRFRETISEERSLLLQGTVDALQKANECVVSRLSTSYVAAEIGRLQREATTPYRLFTLIYAGHYLSLQQAIQLDSIRFAIDRAELAQEQKRWLLIAAGVTLLRVATTTGHFAQFLSPKVANSGFFGRQRRRDFLLAFWDEVGKLEPIGTRQWRGQNKVFRRDAVALLESLASRNQQIAVVYADPPYTEDHYSRFYHLWETLFLYDYPETTGKARYRKDRFQTKFALKSKVEESLQRLAWAANRTGAHFVLSYPENGLLSRIPLSVEEVVGRHYKHCHPIHVVRHAHSTMGASDGNSKQEVNEVIYLATN